MTSRPIYDRTYYQVYDGRPYERNAEWLSFFGGIADEIVRSIAPKTALDAGCAMGFLVEALHERGVIAEGVDISDYAIGQAHASIRPYVRVASIVEPLERRYDLIVTIEVLEHLAPSDAEAAIANLCAHTDDILFSSTPHEYKDLTHVNVQPPEVWAELFARQGFYRDLDFDASFIIPWAVRFRRRADPPGRILMEYERALHRLAQENVALRRLGQELQNQLVDRTNRLEASQALAAELRVQVEDVTHSRAYRLARQIRRLAPLGSRRERWILGIYRAFARVF